MTTLVRDLLLFTYVCTKFIEMTKSKISKAQIWMIFIVSTIICIGFLAFKPSFFWVMLPFMLTSLVYAVDVV